MAEKALSNEVTLSPDADADAGAADAGAGVAALLHADATIAEAATAANRVARVRILSSPPGLF